MADADSENARLVAKVARLEGENRLLRAKIDLLVRKIFGPGSEGVDPAQLELLLDADDEAASKKHGAPAGPQGQAAGADGAKSPEPKPARKPRLPEHLPVEEEQVIVPAPVKACPDAWRKIGEEVTEELDYRPGRFFRRRLVRPKFVRRAAPEAPPVVASLPGRAVEGGIAAPGLIAQVVVSKFCDHLPLYRQEKIYAARHGVEIPRQSLARWVEAAASWLQPVHRLMAEEVFAGGYVQADETPVKYLEPGAGKARQGYYWTYSRPGGDVVFDWRPGRAATCPERFVPQGFEGVIQCDGYGAYPALAKARGGAITLAGCWAHARRKFHEAFQTGAGRDSAWVLKEIGGLYRIERQLRDARAGPEERLTARTHHALPIHTSIGERLHEIKTARRHLPKSQMGRALDYALGQWRALGVYLRDGRVEIDNNLCENTIRPVALGRKNWMFVGAEGAGWRGAVIYSLVESCRRRGIEPYSYLKDALTRLPRMTNHEVWKMTPENWAAARADTKTEDAAS